MYNVIIKNAKVFDGTGKAGFYADVAVKDCRIAAIGKDLEGETTQILDAAGLVLSPGFIDPHTHSDLPLMVDGLAQSKIRQGVTTEVVGNCGSSPAPLMGAVVKEIQAEAEPYGYKVDWTNFGSFLDKYRSQGVAQNVAALAGHNTIRACVLGYDDVQPTPGQQKAMEQLVADAMQQGAHGLSTGLYYPPGFYAKTEEVIGLARVVAQHGGIYASHIRSESDTLMESIREAIEIGRRSGAQVQISHLKLEGSHNFDGADRVLEMIEQANRDGIAVGTDQYPYDASSTWLGAILPNWAQAGGNEAVARRVKDPATRKLLVQDWKDHRLDWENRSGITNWDQILVVTAQGRPEVVGRNVQEIADQDGKDPLETLFDLIAISEGSASAVWFDQLEKNVQYLMKYPRLVTGSDGNALSTEGVLGSIICHPRSYGTFPRVLGHYVRELKLLTLEEAIRKMTSLTAAYFKLEGRGVIREGAWADIVLFDAEKVIDKATFTHPQQYPEGIPHVMVNGEWVIQNGEHTHALPGKVV
ncbi:MAG: D-aminoacylase [Chloroflexi bacterium]|nr:D-aminoacylase [Chloroflexota bacterium]